MYAQEQVDQAVTKSAKEKLAEKFQLKINLAKQDQWKQAVDEADSCLGKHIVERKLFFAKKFGIFTPTLPSKRTHNTHLATATEDNDEGFYFLKLVRKQSYP